MNGCIKNALAPLVLRLGLAVIFLYHGLEKVGAEHRWGAAWTDTIAAPLQFGTAWVEVLGGFALLAGFLTRAAAAATGFVTVGAIVFIHGKYGFALQTGNAFQQGYEYKFALLAMCVTVVLLGGGNLAVDWFFRPLSHTPEPTILGEPAA